MKNSLWPGISIVIANWNGVHLLKQTMDSVVDAQKAYPGNVEIIVVDNGSIDRSIDVLKDFYPSVVILPLDKNYGFATASNEGAKIAKHELLFFLNNDIKVKDDILVELAKPFLTDSEIFSTTPVMNHWDGSVLTDKTFSSAISFSFDQGNIIQKFAIHLGKPTLGTMAPTFYGSGGALLVSAKKFNKIGQFNEIYSPSYWEDTDLCLTAWRFGWPSYYVPTGLCWHKISATSNKQTASFRIRKNFYLFYWLNVSNPLLLWKNLCNGLFDSLQRYFKGDASWTAYFTFLKEDFLKVLWLKITKSRKGEKLNLSQILERTAFPEIKTIDVSFLLNERKNGPLLVLKFLILHFLKLSELALMKNSEICNKFYYHLILKPVQILKVKFNS